MAEETVVKTESVAVDDDVARVATRHAHERVRVRASVHVTNRRSGETYETVELRKAMETPPSGAMSATTERPHSNG